MSDVVPFLDLARETAAVREQLDAAAARVMDRGLFLMGPELESFEDEFAAYTGGAYAIGVASGLAALELILMAYGIGEGDEVIVPANTYIATWIAVTRVGARVVPVEPDEETRNIDPERVAEAVTGRTRAILAVHLYGEPADMKALREIADARGLKLLVDAAQSLGAKIDGSEGATLGDAAAFSFYPTKNLGALADAGAVVTHDWEIAEKVRLLRNYGMRDRSDHPEIGMNARMDEMTAAFLSAKLAVLDLDHVSRIDWAVRYSEEFGQLVRLRLGCGSSFHLFVIQTEQRDALREYLDGVGVQTAIHYPVPPHLSGAYRGKVAGEFPITERLAETALSLPMFPSLTLEEVERVCVGVTEFFER